MGVREPDVEEERFIRFGMTLDVFHRRFGNVTLYLSTVLYVVGSHFSGFHSA